MRRYLLNKPTVAERQIASSITTMIDPNSKDTTDNPLLSAQLDKISKWINNLIIHYTHEQRLESYKKDIHHLWNQTFTETPMMNTKLIVGNRNSQNATKAFFHRGPDQKSSRKTTDSSNEQ